MPAPVRLLQQSVWGSGKMPRARPQRPAPRRARRFSVSIPYPRRDCISSSSSNNRANGETDQGGINESSGIKIPGSADAKPGTSPTPLFVGVLALQVMYFLNVVSLPFYFELGDERLEVFHQAGQLFGGAGDLQVARSGALR